MCVDITKCSLGYNDPEQAMAPWMRDILGRMKAIWTYILNPEGDPSVERFTRLMITNESEREFSGLG